MKGLYLYLYSICICMLARKFREICAEIWVGPAFTRLFSRFGRSGAQERKRPTFEKNARFAGGLRLQDPRIHSVDR